MAEAQFPTEWPGPPHDAYPPMTDAGPETTLNLGHVITVDPLDDYEYGIMRRHATYALHRWGMTRAEAENWQAEWMADGGLPRTFYVVRRPVGDWEPWEGGT